MSDALDKLIEAVEAGTVDATEGPSVFNSSLGDIWDECAALAYHGSLDAAMALHEALLPGWKVAGLHQEDRGLWWAELR